MEKRPIILVFYQNLRFHDEPLLAHAIQQEAPIIPVFINDPELITKLGAASQWWLYESLITFQEQWKSVFGINFILRTGDSIKVLQELVQETEADKIYLGKRYTAPEIAIDEGIQKTFTQQEIEVKFFNTHLLLDPTTIHNQQNKPFQIFTPFWRYCLHKIGKVQTIEETSLIPLKYNKVIHSEALSDWYWGHSQTTWVQKLASYWQPSENKGLERLNKFLKSSLKVYDTQHNLLTSPSFTSLLSPYLRWGQISVRHIFKKVIEVMQINPSIQKDGNAFLNELGWREFSYYLLFHYPSMDEIPLDSQFKNFPWQNNTQFLRRWQKGMTGYPIIDAGMRQLWEEGWMPNRLRMMVASFLTKDLLIDWQHGVAWFGDTLVDADPANNANNWQWVAGCGIDAVPYFRIFNPITQGEKFDPEGKYIKKYVPELKEVPLPYIHRPWEMPADLQEELELIIGIDYPKPIVDHTTQRAKALALWKQLKQQG